MQISEEFNRCIFRDVSLEEFALLIKTRIVGSVNIAGGVF
jgi:hypothetical protein